MPQPPPPLTYDAEGVEFHTIPKFTFLNGTTLHDVKVAYRVFNPDLQKGTVLIPTCFRGWINTTLTFTTAPNDALSEYRVIVAAMLGNGESSSPSNKQFFPDPGEMRYEDVINAHYHMLTEGFGVESLEAVIGFSMGGMQSYHWAVMKPDFVKRIVGICTSARTSPHNYAFLEGPIAAMRNSIDYVAWKQIKQKVSMGEKIGTNLSDVKPKNGIMGFTRAYAAWLSSTAWFREKMWHHKLGFENVDEWIKGSEQNALTWDADDLLILARMWQMGDIGRTAKEGLTKLGGGVGDDEEYTSALKGIKAKVLLMPCRTDQYFPPEDSEIEMQHLQNGKLSVIESIWGHMAGGGANPDDTKFMNEQIRDFMAETWSSEISIRGH